MTRFQLADQLLQPLAIGVPPARRQLVSPCGESIAEIHGHLCCTVGSWRQNRSLFEQYPEGDLLKAARNACMPLFHLSSDLYYFQAVAVSSLHHL
jgi:hypothetical protein